MARALTDPAVVARRIEHTLLKAEATAEDLNALCAEAVEFGFAGVCVNPVYVRVASEFLEQARVRQSLKVVSVAGFPLGANLPATKADEARRALDEGADEIDMVVCLGALRAGDRLYVRREIESLAFVVHAQPGRLLKIILETAALTDEQIILGCRCAAEGEADFVKTSTGFHAAGGATVEAVRLLRRHAPPIRVKAAGGIRTARMALDMIEAGADRLGTSSGPAIIRELRAQTCS